MGGTGSARRDRIPRRSRPAGALVLGPVLATEARMRVDSQVEVRGVARHQPCETCDAPRMSIFDSSRDANGPSAAALACDPDTLLALVRAGDTEALDRLTRCYGTRLLEVGRKQCASDDSAHDAVQDALEAAASHLTDFRGEGSLEGWLSRMVTNACRHMQRGRKADVSLHEPFDDEQSTAANNPEQLALAHDLGEQLVQALQTLTPEDRAIVLLAEVNGWKGPEIAESMGLTPGQVRTRLSRSRSALRGQLAGLWSDWGGGDPKKNPTE